MNEIDARAVGSRRAWYGEIRKVHKAGYEPVCENGIPILYTNALEAELNAWRALKPHLQSIMTSERYESGNKAEIERVFGKGTDR